MNYLIEFKSKSSSGRTIIMEIKNRINEAEVVLLTKVARDVNQHENIQKNIIISGLPESS